jgi:hypothetical protein
MHQGIRKLSEKALEEYKNPPSGWTFRKGWPRQHLLPKHWKI